MALAGAPAAGLRDGAATALHEACRLSKP